MKIGEKEKEDKHKTTSTKNDYIASAIKFEHKALWKGKEGLGFLPNSCQ